MTGVSVVLPNYDGAALLRRYLSGVLAAAGEYGDSEVIVVDDGSADDSVAVLIAEFPGVQVIRHPRNLGFQAACNTGAGAARCGLLLFLNTDMRVGPGLLAAMARHFSDDSVFAVAPKGSCTLGQITSCHESMFAPTGGLGVLAGTNPVRHDQVLSTRSDHAARGARTAF